MGRNQKRVDCVDKEDKINTFGERGARCRLREVLKTQLQDQGYRLVLSSDIIAILLATVKIEARSSSRVARPLKLPRFWA